MFQFMIPQKSLRSKYCLTMGPINLKESDHEELLGIAIDKHLNFNPKEAAGVGGGRGG